jgi:hypothetical protein
MNRSNGYSRSYELVAIVAFVVVAAWLLWLQWSGAKGTVTGKVNFKGMTVPYGVVTIIDREGNRYRGLIHRDGTYTVSDIPRGLATVTVAAPLKGLRLDRDLCPNRFPFGPYVAIPRHYAHPDKSGLSLTVRSGTQDIAFNLKDDFEDAELIRP